MPVAELKEHDVQAADGRTLHVYEGGDPGGTLVLVHHGTPGSGLLAGSWAQDARERGIRLVGFDRAGYGRSDRHPGRTVADAAADSVAVVDALGGGPFRTWGVSGGGPHAIACAVLRPDRVLAAATIASVGPFDGPGLDFLAGMGQGNLDEFGAALAGEATLAEYLAADRAGLLAGGPDGMVAAMESVLPEVDQAVIQGGFAEFMYPWLATGLRTDAAGWLDDDLAFVRPWGLDLAALSRPLLLLQGRADLMVPYAHGEWLAGRLPGVTARLTEDDGHVSLLSQVGPVHEWLLGQ
jgi:pimeloyl-ACP methyl ester carboxylesterase